MTIGIDASRAFSPEKTGTENYSYYLMQNLRAFLEHEEVILYVRKGVDIPFDLPRPWKVQEISWKYLWTQGGLSWELFWRPVDRLLVPSHALPWIHPKRSMIVVHGLEYEHIPEAYPFFSRVLLKIMTRLSCIWGRHIITVSESTKKDLIDFYHIDSEKITTIHQSVSDISGQGIGGSHEGKYNKKSSSRPKSRAERSQSCIKEKVSYFLVLGRLETRKNIIRTIEAFEIFKDIYHTNHRLILAGKPGYGYRKIQRKIQNSKYKKNIIERGYISETEKGKLLEHTETLLFLSRAEGFGLPLLEAQVARVPVIASDIPIMHEIAGEGAYFVKKDDMYEIARNMHEISKNDEKKRGILEKGRKNVVRFSWEQCAREIAEVLLKK